MSDKERLSFEFYSVLKNEDAPPFIGDDLLVCADGLGGAGGHVHVIDYAKHPDMRGELLEAAYGDFDADMRGRLDGYLNIGGGSKDGYLNKLTANALDIPVYTGPTEATAIGNLLSQMLGAKVFSSVAEARECVFNSFDVKKFKIYIGEII